jgi:hypothetical protein
MQCQLSARRYSCSPGKPLCPVWLGLHFTEQERLGTLSNWSKGTLEVRTKRETPDCSWEPTSPGEGQRGSWADFTMGKSGSLTHTGHEANQQGQEAGSVV